MGVSPAEDALFTVIYYGMPASPSDMPALAVREYYSRTDTVTEEECRAALASSLQQGWLQMVDQQRLAKIADELREGQYLGPVYGIPFLGQVDFTPAGAERWHKLNPRDSSASCAYTDAVHIKTAQYFRTQAAAMAAIEEAKQNDSVVSITGPCPIGPWRAQWWRRFPDGYRIDIEDQLQWQGRGGGNGDA